MPISIGQLNDRLSTYLKVNLPKEVFKALRDEDYILIYNDVARDLNNVGQFHLERYYKECNIDNAEDTYLLNYLLRYNPLKILRVKYRNSDYANQYYTFIEDRIVLKSTPPENTILEVRYLRDIIPVEDPTDEIDLPGNVIIDYEQLLKTKVLVDYGGRKDLDYEAILQVLALKGRNKLNENLKSGVRPYWFGQQNDDFLYDITKNYIGIENFTADVDGNYMHVGGND